MKMEESPTRAHSGKTAQPRTSPRSNPPPPTSRKSSPASQIENAPVTTAGHGDPVGYESRAVVHEALTLYYRAHPTRHPQTPEDGLGGDRVGGREDRPQHERHGPRYVDQVVHYKRDSHHRKEYEPDGEQCYRPEVSAKLARRGKEGRVVQERR